MAKTQITTAAEAGISGKRRYDSDGWWIHGQWYTGADY